MERHQLMRLLTGDDEATKAALAALLDGATYAAWEGGRRPSEAHAGIFAIRLRCMRRKGAETLGWERAVPASSRAL